MTQEQMDIIQAYPALQACVQEISEKKIAAILEKIRDIESEGYCYQNDKKTESFSTPDYHNLSEHALHSLEGREFSIFTFVKGNEHRYLILDDAFDIWNRSYSALRGDSVYIRTHEDYQSYMEFKRNIAPFFEERFQLDSKMSFFLLTKEEKDAILEIRQLKAEYREEVIPYEEQERELAPLYENLKTIGSHHVEIITQCIDEFLAKITIDELHELCACGNARTLICCQRILGKIKPDPYFDELKSSFHIARAIIEIAKKRMTISELVGKQAPLGVLKVFHPEEAMQHAADYMKPLASRLLLHPQDRELKEQIKAFLHNNFIQVKSVFLQGLYLTKFAEKLSSLPEGEYSLVKDKIGKYLIDGFRDKNHMLVFCRDINIPSLLLRGGKSDELHADIITDIIFSEESYSLEGIRNIVSLPNFLHNWQLCKSEQVQITKRFIVAADLTLQDVSIDKDKFLLLSQNYSLKETLQKMGFSPISA